MATSNVSTQHCGPYRDSVLVCLEELRFLERLGRVRWVWLLRRVREAWRGRRCKGKSLVARHLGESGESGLGERGHC